MTGSELRHKLAHYTGSEHYYVHPFTDRVRYTDGVKAFAEYAGAYWLIDILVTQPELYEGMLDHGFIVVDLRVKGYSAVLKATTETEDGTERTLYQRDIEFTDCPEGVWKFYLTGGYVLLPSEY